MRKLTIGRLFGIPVQLGLTFLLILPVLAWVIGTQVEQWIGWFELLWALELDPGPLSAGSTPLLLGLLAAIGLFGGVLLHEFGHSLVALRYDVPIESITLWVLGGISQFEDQPENWKQEFYIAIAGPAVSVGVGALSYGGVLLTQGRSAVLVFLLGYLTIMNFALAAFNMLPGFPMDGGRVLRALLARDRPFAQATKIAAEVGKLFAILLALLGLFLNLFFILLAFFIYIGASNEAQQTAMNAAFEGVRVRDIMTPQAEVESVAVDTSVADLLERMFRQRHTGYPVLENDQLVGVVTLGDARGVKDVERDAFTVSDVMSQDLETIGPKSNVMDAFEAMQQRNIGRLVVVEDDEIAGLISRTDIMTALDIIRDSGGDASIPPASDPSEPESPSLER